MQRDSDFYTFKVAVLLCLVCSVVVSTLAVGLRDIQKRQKETFRQENILKAAGLYDEKSDEDVSDLYQRIISPVFIDLETNAPTERVKEGDKELDPKAAARDPKMYTLVTDLGDNVRDVASIRKREKYSTIYEVRKDGKLETLIVPIRGYGLWSTLWGYIALDMTKVAEGPESITVKGLAYYEHGETPGLGGEVENDLWRNKWPGKSVFDAEWNVQVEVSKSATTNYQVDALSGATITSNGVTNMLHFWLGKYGFGPYLKSLAGTPTTTVAHADVNASRDDRHE